MRKTFAQVLKAGKIDLKNEYTKFYDLFYSEDSRDGRSMADIVSDNFINLHFRGTCLSLEEFDRINGFNFQEQPQDFDEEYLVSFMEYIYNLVAYINDWMYFSDINKSFYLNQIQLVVDKIGYMSICEDGLTSFVPRDCSAIAVAEQSDIPDDVSYRVLEYSHHSMKRNIEAKKDTLIKLASILEAKRKNLEALDDKFASDLFLLINSCNIRHNNKDESSGKYRKYIAEIEDDELEKIYDEIYQMCLLAFMKLEHNERKAWLDDTKNNIVNTK